MKPRGQATSEARRADLFKRIMASADVNSMQAFCAMIACGFALASALGG